MGQLTFRRKKKPVSSPPPTIEVVNNSTVTASKAAVGKKKAGGARLWMRLDRWGHSELIECDKSVILKRVSIPSRDLRILGPIFSHSSRILGTSSFTFWRSVCVLFFLFYFAIFVFNFDDLIT